MVTVKQVVATLGVLGIIMSVSCCGSSPTSTDALVPEAPLNLRVVGITVGPEKTTVIVRWEHPEDNGYPITRYELKVYKGSDSCGESTENQGKYKTFEPATGAEETIGITDLSEGAMYSFNVRAKNENGWGPYSDCIFIQTE